MHDLVLRRARLSFAAAAPEIDLAIDDGCWSLLGTVSEAGRQEIDLAGEVLLPGGVDLHVHFNEPGRTHWEGFETGSRAALAGGLTTVAEMPLNAIPATTTVDALRIKRAAIEGKSYTDYGLWGGLQPDNLDQLDGLAAAGVMGFKAFLCPSGTDEFAAVNPAQLREGMKRLAPTGLVLAVHAEDPATLAEAASGNAPRTSASDWEASRPVAAELRAIEACLTAAKATGCRLHIVHISSPACAALVASAVADGVAVTCETCPHYLAFTLDDAARLGPMAKCAPPLRPEATRRALWEAVAAGQVHTLGSDHSPCPPDLKGGTFFDAWGGINGVQDGWRWVLEAAAETSPALADHLVKMGTSRPAALVGWRQKGQIAPGADADAWWTPPAPDGPRRLGDGPRYARHDLSPYADLPTRRGPVSGLLRGKLVVNEGAVLAAPSGTFLHGQAWAGSR